MGDPLQDWLNKHKGVVNNGDPGQPNQFFLSKEGGGEFTTGGPSFSDAVQYPNAEQPAAPPPPPALATAPTKTGSDLHPIFGRMIYVADTASWVLPGKEPVTYDPRTGIYRRPDGTVVNPQDIEKIIDQRTDKVSYFTKPVEVKFDSKSHLFIRMDGTVLDNMGRKIYNAGSQQARSVAYNAGLMTAEEASTPTTSRSNSWLADTAYGGKAPAAPRQEQPQSFQPTRTADGKYINQFGAKVDPRDYTAMFAMKEDWKQNQVAIPQAFAKGGSVTLNEEAYIVGKSGTVYGVIGEKTPEFPAGQREKVSIKPTNEPIKKTDNTAPKKFATGGSVFSDPRMNEAYRRMLGSRPSTNTKKGLTPGTFRMAPAPGGFSSGGGGGGGSSSGGGGGGSTSTSRSTSESTTRSTNINYVNVPTPEQFLDEFKNGFSTYIRNLRLGGQIGVNQSMWMMENMDMFLGEYLGELGARAERGEDVYKAVNLGTYESGSSKTTSSSQTSSSSSGGGSGGGGGSFSGAGGAVGGAPTGFIKEPWRTAPVPVGGTVSGFGGSGGGGGGGGGSTSSSRSTGTSTSTSEEEFRERPAPGYVATLSPMDFLKDTYSPSSLEIIYEGRRAMRNANFRVGPGTVSASRV